MNEEKFKTIQQKIEKDYENITGIIVQKNNQLLYEHYFNDCDVSSKIHVYSISKSILSLLLGIAQGQGSISEMDRPILDYFPVSTEGFNRQGDYLGKLTDDDYTL